MDSFRGKENVLKLTMVMAAHICNYTKTHRTINWYIIYFVNYILVKVFLKMNRLFLTLRHCWLQQKALTRVSNKLPFL